MGGTGQITQGSEQNQSDKYKVLTKNTAQSNLKHIERGQIQ